MILRQMTLVALEKRTISWLHGIYEEHLSEYCEFYFDGRIGVF